MGVLSSYELLKKTALSKPAVIGYNLNIFSAQSTPFPIQENPKIAFYETPITLANEVSIFAKTVNAKKLAFIGDASLIGYPDFPIIRDKILEKSKPLGLDVSFIPVTDKESPALKALDRKKVDGVIFLPTWRTKRQGRYHRGRHTARVSSQALHALGHPH